jgi:hypothetical protein
LRAIRSVLQYSRNSLARQEATLDAMSFVDSVDTAEFVHNSENDNAAKPLT